MWSVRREESPQHQMIIPLPQLRIPEIHPRPVSLPKYHKQNIFVLITTAVVMVEVMIVAVGRVQQLGRQAGLGLRGQQGKGMWKMQAPKDRTKHRRRQKLRTSTKILGLGLRRLARAAEVCNSRNKPAADIDQDNGVLRQRGRVASNMEGRRPGFQHTSGCYASVTRRIHT